MYACIHCRGKFRMLLEWASEQNVHLVQAQLVPFLDIRNEKHPFLRALIWARAEHIIFLRIYTPSPHLISINHYHVRAHVWLFLYHVSPHWKRHIGLVLLSYLFSRLQFKMKCSDNTNFTMGIRPSISKYAPFFEVYGLLYSVCWRHRYSQTYEIEGTGCFMILQISVSLSWMFLYCLRHCVL